MDIFIDVQGMDRVVERLERLPATLRQEVRGQLTTALQPVVAEAESQARVDRGVLANSIGANGVVILEDGSAITARVGPGLNASAYARAQEYGWASDHAKQPPTDPLVDWVHRNREKFADYFAEVYHFRTTKKRLRRCRPRRRRHRAASARHGGMAPGRVKAGMAARASRLERSLAFFIARKIGEGPPDAHAHPYMTPAWERHKANVVTAVQAAIQTATRGA